MVKSESVVDARLAAAVAAHVSGTRVNVAQVCRELEISRETFYVYARRFAAEGVAGLLPRSRRPHTSPRRSTPELEERVVQARQELLVAGWDGGALTVRAHLLDQGVPDVPSRATVHRILAARDQVPASPAKRPRRAYRRFQAAAPNAMWQMDGFEVRLADRARVVVIHVLDDHSRLDIACLVAASESSAAASRAFLIGAGRYGLPACLLTDNGTAFSGRRRGYTTRLETDLRQLGVKPICSSVGHPQTCGKIERAHKTARAWLARRGPAHTPADLQAQLEDYRADYNQRRHQSLDGRTPQAVFDRTPKAEPRNSPLSGPLTLTERLVDPRGAIQVGAHVIGLGAHYTGARTTILHSNLDVAIFIDNALIHTLRLDPTRRYQPKA